jgi:hypothetical protein
MFECRGGVVAVCCVDLLEVGVVVYSDDGHLLLVTGGRLYTIWVVCPLQTGVAARALSLDFVFL